MEQKEYNLEIVNILLDGKNHIRGIAAELKINHMLVSRKVNELAQSNVVNFTWNGKNKSYFLKKTAEARAYVFMAENYKLVRILVKNPGLRNIIEKLQKDKRLDMAILFGSYAKELETKNSDIDLYIETKDKDMRKELQLLDSRLSIKIGRYDRQNLLIKEIEKNHVIIKGIEIFYEKRFCSILSPD